MSIPLPDTEIRTSGPISEVTAGANLSQFRVIAVPGSSAVHADSANILHAGRVRGVLLASVSTGETAKILTLGPVATPGANWTADRPLYFDSTGALTLTRPTTGFAQVIGRTETAGQIFVLLGEPVEASERHIHVHEPITLQNADISAKYVILSNTPLLAMGVMLDVEGAPNLRAGVDYQMDDSNPRKLTWNSLLLDGLLAAGDKLMVHYYRLSAAI